MEVMTTLGAIFPPQLPPEQLRSVTIAAEHAGLEQLWLWEDCFAESGIAMAATALASSEKLVVGIGLLPVPLRNVALTAMEIATIERLFPGRLIPGVGHGVLDWMAQVGARAESPMTLLREYTLALRGLLAGERVTTSGRYVNLTDVALDWPVEKAPPVLIGAVKERTTALAGEVADGVIFTGSTPAEKVADRVGILNAAWAGAGRTDSPVVVCFIDIAGRSSAGEIAARIEPFCNAGATHAILYVSDDMPLSDFVQFVAQEVRPLVA
jgi:alkanesulfonate monooxygenase SsuD/methylene tetrahydromethanopterin reductase-like flavin-dependent oxidoreductase (luciferase family)